MNKLLIGVIATFIIGISILLYFMFKSCPSGNFKSGLKCVKTCPTGQVGHDGKCKSACPKTGEMYNQNSVCVSSCASGKRVDSNCVTDCPTSKPYTEAGVCVASCSSGKREGNTCVATCSASNPVLTAGVCGPCSQNTTNLKLNDNGVCVSVCPSTRPINDNGVCVPTINLNTPGHISSSSAFWDGNVWERSFDGDYNTLWNPSSIDSTWTLFKFQTPLNIKGFKIKFHSGSTTGTSATTPQILKLYKNVNTTGISTNSNPVFPSENEVYTNTFTRSEDVIIQAPLNLTNVNNIVVKLNKRTYIYDVEFY